MWVRRILGIPFIYNLFGKIVGNRANWNSVRDCVGDVSNKRLLDLGCGTGSILNSFANEARYAGVDYSENYIQVAKEVYRDRNSRVLLCGFEYVYFATDLQGVAPCLKSV